MATVALSEDPNIAATTPGNWNSSLLLIYLFFPLNSIVHFQCNDVKS